MSHYHCEIILPPTDDIAAAVASIMGPFDESPQDADEDYYSRSAFWDFYVIGGRFAGEKAMSRLDKGVVAEFYEWLKSEHVTCAGFTAGKQEISPASQIPKVDAKWNELFPSSGGVMVACPLFKHSNDQYGKDGNGTIDGDICPLSDAKSVACGRVIFAGASFDGDTKERTGPLEATFMLCGDQWNGVNHMPVKWDGTIQDALTQFEQRLEHYKDEYRKQMSPQDDWLTVTVDYHS